MRFQPRSRILKSTLHRSPDLSRDRFDDRADGFGLSLGCGGTFKLADGLVAAA